MSHGDPIVREFMEQVLEEVSYQPQLEVKLIIGFKTLLRYITALDILRRPP
jgi:hypothetical protein